MVKWELIVAIVAGSLIFLSDLLFGWLTLICGPIPVIFIIAIIIGIFAGNVGDALLSTFLSWVLGILLGVLLAPLIFAGLLAEGQDFFGLFLLVFLYSLRGMFSWQLEGTIVEVFLMGFIYLIVMLVVAPIIYLISFVFAVLGGIIGKLIRERFIKEKSPIQQTRQGEPESTDLQ
ncbi:MAG: hypothetical protein JW779_04030 [Candidatus Thorarchaeota archaeon]|nr:hypothetical protein [Candidatus Thorarchaeota archaeon]